jgi:hypothetical protein
MSDRDEYGRRIPDDDEREESYYQRQRARVRSCKCGHPDWPGHCPGWEYCPVHGEGAEVASK